MSSQGEGDSKMAATGQDEVTKVKDVSSDVSNKEKRFGQKATKDSDGTKVQQSDDADGTKVQQSDDTAKASGKTSGKAEDDDAVKNQEKINGEAESDDQQGEAYVSPEEPSETRLEAKRL